MANSKAKRHPALLILDQLAASAEQELHKLQKEAKGEENSIAIANSNDKRKRISRGI